MRRRLIDHVLAALDRSTGDRTCNTVVSLIEIFIILSFICRYLAHEVLSAFPLVCL